MNTMAMNLMAQPKVAEVAVAKQPELKSADERQFLDFDVSKCQILTLEQLERTERENDAYGKPLKGIYHHELIHRVMDMCKSYGYDPEIYDLFASNNKDKKNPGVSILPQKEAQFGDRAVEAHILRRVYCNIRLRDFDKGEGKNEVTTNMAVSFHQRGIQLGIGRNCVICHNTCMLSPEQYAATYSDTNSNRKSYTLEELLSKADEWLQNLRGIVASDDEKIEAMKAREISAQEMFTIIGMLTALRVSSETKYKEIRNLQTIPLNQAQIGRLTEKMMLTYHEQNKVTVWDFYNAATDMYKPHLLDQPMILSQNMAMVSFINQNLI